MKAKIKPRIDLYNCDQLKEAIPLRTPYVIYIDPCDTCNFQCKFCPTGNRQLMQSTSGRYHGPMDFEQYKQIIISIGAFEEKVKVIRLYKDGEPLLNPHLPEMIQYAKASGCCEYVDTTTNASLLTQELSLRLIDAGLDRINISVEGMNEEQYLDFSRYKINFQKFVDNIAFFYEHRKQCEMNIKINGGILTEEQKQQFYKTFGNITDGIFVEYPIDYWPTFEQDKVEIDETISILGNKAKKVNICPYIFYEMAINADGSYSMCRFDWKRCLLMGHELGIYKSPKKIWDSNRLWQIQYQMLNGKTVINPFCAQCGELKQGVSADLDAYAELLMDRF